MMPLGCSGCGHDRVKLLMVELIWCMMGTMEGAAEHRRNGVAVLEVNDERGCFQIDTETATKLIG